MEKFLLSNTASNTSDISNTASNTSDISNTASNTSDISNTASTSDISNFILDGVIQEKTNNYNSFVLSKKKMWRIPDKELKVYIIENKILSHSCKICNHKPIWRNKPLELVLDRINNDILDNNLDNLRFLCPNCYSQVKKKNTIFEKNIKDKQIKCEKCGKRIKYKTFSVNKKTNVEKFCKPCLQQERLELLSKTRCKYPRE